MPSWGYMGEMGQLGFMYNIHSNPTILRICHQLVPRAP